MVASVIGRIVAGLAPYPLLLFDMAYLASSSSGPTTTAPGPPLRPFIYRPAAPELSPEPLAVSVAWLLHVGGRVE